MQDRNIEEIEQELTTLAGQLNAGNYRWLMLLAEFDARQGYAGWAPRPARTG